MASKNKRGEVISIETNAVLKTVDMRIANLTRQISGDKLDSVLEYAKELLPTGKTTERALADALEQYKLV